MKKIKYTVFTLTLLVGMVFHSALFATTYTVLVGNNFFNPSSLNVVVGDIVKWVWAAGNHTTTSTTIPAGAATWNKPINSANLNYSYTVTTVGIYHYQCAIHGAGMSGAFTATTPPPVLTVTPPNQDVNATAGATSFNVISNVTWNAISNQTWCSITPAGSGNGVIDASYTENTSPNLRVATITVSTAGLEPINVTVTQAGVPDRSLNLTVYLEGLYTGGGIMSQANDETGPHFSPGIADQVTIELHNATNYPTIEYTSGPVDLSITGNIAITGIPAILNGSYYITIKHRKSIETTSALPVSFAGSTINYNFSNAAAMAYGNNMILMGSLYAIWGGDVSHDGIVDSGDMNPVENASVSLTMGYVDEDANGDGLVDSGDMNIVENNSIAIVTAITP